MRLQHAAVLLGSGVIVSLSGAWAPAPERMRIRANDNTVAAGRVLGDTLMLRLVVRRANWYPEAENGPYATVEAFGEEGKSPTIPAPLIRVRAGQAIRASIHNALPDSTIHLIGLAEHPIVKDDTIHLAPGRKIDLDFQAGAAGTYIYRAVIGNDPDTRASERETAAGAFVVDPPGGSPPDRILVMNIFSEPLDSLRGREALAINGKSWPYTKRFHFTAGDSVRWRVVNATVRAHPMHLHGFYFASEAKGDGRMSRDISVGERPLEVTDNMAPWETRTMVWSPDRPGNWLYHCHLTFHVIPEARLDHDPTADHQTHDVDPAKHMAGLVVGMSVAPRRGVSYTRASATRTIDLFVQEGRGWGRKKKSFSYIARSGDQPPAPDSVQRIGSLLVMTRGEPTDVVVHNRAQQPVGIHWHGIELESWSDGVAGWSGEGRKVAPPVRPGERFTARLTLPRAGSFIYHTHLNDIEQVVNGALGPIVVLEPGERYDPTRDHVYLAGWSGDVLLQVNGDTLEGPPLEYRAGVPHRFRLMNLGPANSVRYRLVLDSAEVEWTPRAKDGADLPLALRRGRPALQRVSVGETYDFELTPAPGSYTLLAGFGLETHWRQRIVFR